MKKVEIEKFTLCRDDSIMEGWPDLIKLKSGRLLVAYNECVAHPNRDHSHITLRYSDDGGKSWSEKKYVGEETFHGDHWNSIRLSQLSDGRIMLVCDRVVESELSEKCGLYAWESFDGGESFSGQKKLGITGFCSDKVRELDDGSLIICVSKYNALTGKNMILAHKSLDGGESWGAPVTVANCSKYSFIEPALLQLTSGELVVFLRENSFMNYNGFAVKSKDRGESFGEIFEIPLAGMHRPFVARLSDGKIMLTYREFLDRQSRNLKACVFDESEIGESDGFDIFLVDRDESDEPDSGYSAWAELDGGEIFMVNYIVADAPKAHIRGYRLRMERA